VSARKRGESLIPRGRHRTALRGCARDRIERALTAQATDPEAARGLWERIDRQIVDQAPWVPLVNPKVVDVLSKRVGNYQYNPYGVLIDQLWVR
jgi:peptide/nickel transport system substrate-binding protein